MFPPSSGSRLFGLCAACIPLRPFRPPKRPEELRSKFAGTASHAIGIHHDARASEEAIIEQWHADPKVRRRAAEALAGMKVAEAIEPLLESAPSMQSRVLEHVVVQALVQLDADSETLVDVVTSSDKPQAKRIALLALSQLNDSEQVAALVGESLSQKHPLRDALWIWFHPEWGETLRQSCAKSEVP